MTKTIFDNTVSSLNSEIAVNKTKKVSIENELKKLKTFDLGYFVGKSYFEEDGAQNYLVFQSIHKYFKITNKKVSHHGNLRDYLTKLLHLMLCLIIALLH